jgi:hypothetical protein
MTMENNNNDELPSFQAGDVVLTAYGVGVIVSGKENDFYRVRLWRIPGRSMGSSALALLQPSAVSHSMPIRFNALQCNAMPQTSLLVH